MTAFYSEHDPFAAQWLRNLIAAGLIAPGIVVEGDIREIRPADLAEFTQCHFFAGIGIWSLALRKAGWPDDRPIWTGSCPCQPFSSAGKGAGFDDERHLWPDWFWLVSQCRPPIVVGEQVASQDGLGWIDLVSADLEGSNYAFGAVDLCAAGITMDWQNSVPSQWLSRAIRDCDDSVIAAMLCDFARWAGEGNLGIGGNHIRQRLYFVGLADSEQPRLEGLGWNGDLRDQPGWVSQDAPRPASARRNAGRLADATSRVASAETEQRSRIDRFESEDSLALREQNQRRRNEFDRKLDGRASFYGGHDIDWLFCRDGKWRPVESGTFPLAHGIAGRLGKLRAYGNGLDAETATRFCETLMEICP